MKNNLLAILAFFITIWFLATAKSLPDTQTLSITNSHLLFNWRIYENFNWEALLFINIFCLPIFIFFLKFLWEEKTKNIDSDLILIAGIAGMSSALPDAGWTLLIALILYFILTITFNNGLEKMITTIKYTLFFYFFTLTFFALSGFGLIIALTVSLVIGSLAGTLFEAFKKILAIIAMLFIILLLIIFNPPLYKNTIPD